MRVRSRSDKLKSRLVRKAKLPGSTHTPAAGINDNGAITGGCTGSKDAIHGYIRTQK